MLSGLAARVPRVAGPLVCSITYRHPAVLANIAAAVDNISHGRLLLGLGAGWQVNEHAAYGIELGTGPNPARPVRGGVPGGPSGCCASRAPRSTASTTG